VRCPSCKKRIGGTARFCPSCGYQILDREPDPARRAVFASALVFAGVLGAILTTGYLAPVEYSTTTEELVWSSLAYGLVVAVGLAAVAILGRGALFDSLAARPAPSALVLGALGGLLCFGISHVYVWSIAVLAEEVEPEPMLEGGRWALFASMVILPAFVEEWTDRGVLWIAIRRVAGTGGAIFATALLFGMSHGLGGGGPLEVPHRFAVGLVLGWLRARTGSLWPGILAHGMLNTLAISL